MPNLSPWFARPGVTQGRIAPSGWTAPEGTHVFCLGSDVPDVFATLQGNDYAEVFQSGDLTGVQFIRFQGHTRPPTAVPAGAAWRVSLYVNGGEQWHRTLIPGGPERTTIDVAAKITSPGVQAISWRLTLVGTGGVEYEAELPAFYVDAVILDSSETEPFMSNRDPEPGETRVPADTLIALQPNDGGHGSPQVDTLRVWINGAPAMVGLVFQPGFDGPGSSLSGGIVIDPTTNFGSLAVVSVRCALTWGDGTQQDETWTFTVADTSAPRVVAAFAPDHETIRVTFDESVFQGDGTTLADALRVANYQVDLIAGAPAITPLITAVAASSSKEVLLACDIPMTRGATYKVTVTNVTDVFGNMIVYPDNEATFTGYACDVPPGRNLSVFNFWSDQMRQDDTPIGDLARLSAIWQEVVDLILCLVDRFPDTLDPDIAPEEWLDLTLADLGNPFSFDLSLLDKRRLAQVLVAIYKSKGTDPGVVDAIRFFMGLEVTIATPWILDDGALLDVGTLGGEAMDEGPGTLILSSSDPEDVYAFEVVTAQVLTDLERSRMTELVRYMKRAGVRFTIVEPIPPAPVESLMILGVSRLDVDWRLG